MVWLLSFTDYDKINYKAACREEERERDSCLDKPAG